MFQVLRGFQRTAGLVALLAFTVIAPAALAQTEYPESIPVDGRTLNYTYTVETGYCGYTLQTTENEWSGFSCTPTCGSQINLGGDTWYNYPCRTDGFNGDWNDNPDDTGSRYTLSLSSTGGSQSCTGQFIASIGNPDGDANISCGLPTPPSNATTFQNLQWAGLSQDPTPPPSGAYWLSGTNTGGGNCGSGSGGPQPGQSVSGWSSTYGSLEMTDTNTGNSSCPTWNVLGVLDVDYYPTTLIQQDDNLGHFEYQLKFYLPSGINYQALEFDPDLTLDDATTGVPFTYWASVQCDSATGDWRYYNSDNSAWGWVDTGQLCSTVYTKGGGWIAGSHTLAIYVTMDPTNHQYTYQQIIADGSSVITSPIGPVNACDGSLPADEGGQCPNWRERIWAEEQLDNQYPTSSSTESAYYDFYNLTVW
jgi:hypothetical protein